MLRGRWSLRWHLRGSLRRLAHGHALLLLLLLLLRGWLTGVVRLRWPNWLVLRLLRRHLGHLLLGRGHLLLLGRGRLRLWH